LLAGLAGNDGAVPSGSKLSTSDCQSADSVGKVACRALAGSGGIAGHCTTTGGKGSRTVAQPVSSSGSAYRLSLSQCGALGLGAGDFGKGLDTAGLFGSGKLFGIDGSSGKGCALGGMVAGLLGQLEVRTAQPPGLRAEGCQAQGQGSSCSLESNAGNHRNPAACAAANNAARFWNP
jgi:hypothetical protein